VRIRVVLLTAAAALVVLYLLKTMSGPDATERTEEQARVPRIPRGAAETAASVPPSLRNVFEYSEAVTRPAAAAAVRPAISPTLPVVAAPIPSPSPLVRLVGLVHRGGRTKAALAVAGDTVVLAPGESASGYTVVSIDEDDGVRVTGPDGATLVLSAASDR
jgi:hypothetical protein